MFSFIDLLIVFGVVAGPTKALAVMMASTGHLTPAERRAVAFKGVLTATIILFVFALLGQQIIKMFHVSVPALEIAGGIILFVFAINLVLGEKHDDEGARKGDISIYPLAMPLIASPQAIVAIVVIMARAQDMSAKVTAWSALGAQMAINLVVLVAVASLGGKKEQGGGGVAEVILRVVAILLCALAVELVLLGLRDLGIIPKTLTTGH
jgi:multiple antibiotic resistance protein